jgi:hypothetical protein
MDTTLRTGGAPTVPAGASSRNQTPARVDSARLDVARDGAPAVAQQVRAGEAPPRRGLANWDTRLQGDVARAQQAMDYLNRVETELEAVKAALSAKLAGARSSARDLESKARALSASLASRSSKAGGGVDARLDFEDGQSAQQQFRIQGLELDTLRASAPLSMAFSVGGAGGPQLASTIEPDMSDDEIAARLDRTLAPLNVRASLDQDRQLVFSTDEANWPGVRDSIVISGRGRAQAQPVQQDLNLSGMDGGNADALRQSLREVVRALERVRRSQEAASNALAAATMRTVESKVTPADLQLSAQDFASTASSHNYASLLAITSALVGVSRERVVALLGQR